MEVSINTHASIKFTFDKIIYVDPFDIKDNINDADIIFITHNHYDHFDIESINKIIKDDTIIVMPENMKSNEFNNAIYVKPDNQYNVLGIDIKTTYSYNIDKDFHKKEYENVGYILNIENKRYYIMGDTDIIPEIKYLDVDYIFIPIGGKYTCDYIEASNYINEFDLIEVTPIHYGSIVGDIDLGNKFRNLIKENIKVNILIGGKEND